MKKYPFNMLDDPRNKRKTPPPTALERAMEFYLTAHKIKSQREFYFHPVLGWRFDFAILEHKIAIECEGGIYSGGAHSRPAGILRDIAKYNDAAIYGWRVFRAHSVSYNAKANAAAAASNAGMLVAVADNVAKVINEKN